MPNIDLTSISLVTDAEAARLAAPAAFADLARQIAAMPVSPAPLPAGADPLPAVGPVAGPGSREPRPGPGHRMARHLIRRRSLLVGLPVAALAGAAALVVGLLVSGGGNGANSKAAVQALSFTKANGYIKVIIRNPYADTAWYNADFARHNLNVKLSMVPVSPSLVGTIVFEGGTGASLNDIKTITAKGRCFTYGSGNSDSCPIGIKVPVDFHGEADISVGRAAKRGEQYASTTSIFGPGEALAGLRSQVIGQRVSKVWALLARHHLKVAVCRDPSNSDVNPAEVPGDYYVTGMLPWAPGEVIAWTGPTPPSGM